MKLSSILLIAICVLMVESTTTTTTTTTFGPPTSSDSKPTRGNLVATLPSWGYYFKVSLWIWIENFDGDTLGWSEVFRFQTTDKDCCSPGDRIPALFVNKNGYLHGSSQVGTDGDSYKDVTIPAQTWIKVEFSQYPENGKVFYEFKVGDSVMKKQNFKPTLYKDVKVWMSSNNVEWQDTSINIPAANARIKDFQYLELSQSFEGNTNCPKSLTYGGGSQKYRFVEHIDSLPSPQYLPCVGDIDKCVYTAHRKFYCMNGNKPDYKPFELNPHHEGGYVIKDVSTYAGTYDTSGVTGIDFDTQLTSTEPLISIKLFPNEFARRSVFGGFIMKTYQTGGGTTSYPRGFTNQLSYAKNTYIYLEIGEGITEAFGSAGEVIDMVSFGVTPNPANSDKTPTVYSVGGFNGLGYDATPDPALNGPCYLYGLSGQTTKAQPVQYIKALRFLWQCVGKPTHYTY